MRPPEPGDNPRGLLPGAAGLAAIGILAAVLAFSFQGSRGIWEPDEGFYVNVAMGMVQSGDWLVPRLNGLPFLDKPPLNYWGMAAGMRLFGIGEWGARLAQALWFVGAVLLVGALGRRMHGEAAGRLAALIYATTLLPFFAANILTSDTPLAFCAVLAFYCYWRAQEDGGARSAAGWWIALGAAAGLGILAKGPAMLVFLAPLVLHFLWRRGLKGALLLPWGYLAIVLALAIGGTWYALIATRLPGAAAYFLDNQAVGRLVTTTYHRNAGLAGGLQGLSSGPAPGLPALVPALAVALVAQAAGGPGALLARSGRAPAGSSARALDRLPPPRPVRGQLAPRPLRASALRPHGDRDRAGGDARLRGSPAGGPPLAPPRRGRRLVPLPDRGKGRRGLDAERARQPGDRARDRRAAGHEGDRPRRTERQAQRPPLLRISPGSNG